MFYNKDIFDLKILRNKKSCKTTLNKGLKFQQKLRATLAQRQSERKLITETK
jgi:hypothetical protein